MKKYLVRYYFSIQLPKAKRTYEFRAMRDQLNSFFNAETEKYILITIPTTGDSSFEIIEIN